MANAFYGENSLLDLDTAVLKFFYIYFKASDNETWLTEDQVFYVPNNDWNTVNYILNLREGDQEVKYPFVAVTKSNIDDTNDISRKPVLPKYRGAISEDETTTTSYLALPMKFMVTLTFFADEFHKCERFIQQMMFLRSYMKNWVYQSPALNNIERQFTATSLGIDYGPKPVRSDRTSGEGSIYTVNLRYLINGDVVMAKDEVKRILDVVSTINTTTLNNN